MTVTFETTTSIAAPPEVVFDLSLDIDTHLDSQAAANEQAVGGVTTGQIGLGEDVTWRATHFRIPFTMTSRVTELERPHRFVDEQTRGPFRRFHHEHEFRSSGTGTGAPSRTIRVALTVLVTRREQDKDRRFAAVARLCARRSHHQRSEEQNRRRMGVRFPW